jgi:hypothetical protein
MVLYRSKMPHGKNKKNFSISSAEEFIAAIIQHIPDKNFQLVRYFGVSLCSLTWLVFKPDAG